jgi:hypothetical protein
MAEFSSLKTSTASTCSQKSRPESLKQEISTLIKKRVSVYTLRLSSPFNSSSLYGVVCVFLPAAVARLRLKLLAKSKPRNNFLTHIVGEIHARGPSCLISSVRARRASERARCNLFDSDEQKLELKLAPPSAVRASYPLACHSTLIPLTLTIGALLLR